MHVNAWIFILKNPLSPAHNGPQNIHSTIFQQNRSSGIHTRSGHLRERKALNTTDLCRGSFTTDLEKPPLLSFKSIRQLPNTSEDPDAHSFELFRGWVGDEARRLIFWAEYSDQVETATPESDGETIHTTRRSWSTRSSLNRWYGETNDLQELRSLSNDIVDLPQFDLCNQNNIMSLVSCRAGGKMVNNITDTVVSRREGEQW